MKKLVVILLVTVLVASCSPDPSAGGINSSPSETLDKISTSTYTIEPTITKTPQPTKTKLPTLTPRPTSTKAPTGTPTATPEPVVFSGSGDNVIDINKWEGPALLKISYSGSRNFVIWSLDRDGEENDLLVNTIGKYDGTRLIDIVDNEYTQRLSVEASGSWEIILIPFEMIKKVDVPSIIEGLGDDVILLDGGSKNPDLLKIDASTAERNFIIRGYGKSVDLLVNEIAPYSGTIVIPARVLSTNGLIVLEIMASGPWIIEVTVR